ncbi:MAG TPA: hypothetical protein VHQ86_00345 [Candidatus Saccharimonadia bacterium]|nr:hypothetical protein [Candidatus Saccharimonadia bacterium]
MKLVRRGVFAWEKPIIWLQLAAILIAVIAGSFSATPAKAAAGDPNDPQGLWVTHGTIQYNGLSYNLLADNNSFGNNDVFSTSSATCNDVGSKQDRPTSADGYLVVPRDAPGTTGNDGSARLEHVDPGNNGANGSNCQTFTGGTNGPKTITLVKGPTGGRHSLFYRLSDTGGDADRIFTYNGSVEFDRDRANYHPSGGGYSANTEVYVRSGEGVCGDLLVNNGGTWLLFPMTPVNSVKQAWPNSPSFDNVSEDYNAIASDAQNRCRVTSEEIIFTYRITRVAGVIGPDSDDGVGYSPPGSGGFDGRLIDVDGSNFCNEIGLGPNGPPKWVDVDSSRGLTDSGVTIHEVDMSCNHHDNGRNDNYIARRSWESSADYSWTGHATVKQKGVHYFDPAELRVLHSDKDDNGYTVVGGVATLPAAVTPPTPGTPPAGGTAEPVDCNAGAFTWLVCPIIHALVDVSDWIRDNLLLPLLKEDPLSTSTGIYQIWQAMRNVASVFFILVFFLIIIGTAVGFDNYTIKKVLPHLVAGAILVPLSWYVCAILIDIANVIGQGIVALVSSVIPTVNIDFTSSYQQVFFGAGGVMAVTIAYFAFAGISLAMLMTILFGLLAAVGTLLFRRIVIVALIILSPFALLAWVLPNTESWFKRWWRSYFRVVMMFPFIMMFIEAGRIFSATAGAAFGQSVALLSTHLHIAALGLPLLGVIDAKAVGAALVPLAQEGGLVVPLILIPKLVPKLEDEFMQLGAKGIGAARNAADKQFGQNSERAKEAAENRVRNSIRRDREYNDKAASASGLNKMRYNAMSRFNARRAGVPRGFKWTGGTDNETRELKRESMYSKAQGEHGIHEANKANSAEKLPKETQGDRERAEIRMAQIKKINERAQRMGLVADMDETGAAGIKAGNAAMYRAGLTNSARASANERGTAIGQAAQYGATPQRLKAVSAAAAINAQTKVAQDQGAVTGTIRGAANLDRIMMENEHAAGRTGVTLEEARRLRMDNLAKSTDIKTGKQMLQTDVDVNATNTAEADLNQAARAAHGGISMQAAQRLRMRESLAAGTAKGRDQTILGEAEERTYNEVRRQSGGEERASDLLEAGRLLSRQGIVDERQKRYGALQANAANPVATNDMINASRYTNTKSFATAQGAVAGTLAAAQAEAARDSQLAGTAITAGTNAAAQAAARRSFEAGRIQNEEHLAEAFGKEQGMASAHAAVPVSALDTAMNSEGTALRTGAQHSGTILAENAAAGNVREDIRGELARTQPGFRRLSAADQERAIDTRMATNAGTAAGLEGGRKLAAALGQDQGATNDFNDKVADEMALTGASRGQAIANVNQRRLTASRVSGRTRGERDAATADATDAGALRSVETEIENEISANAARGVRISRATATANVRRRELGAIGAQAEEKSAKSVTAEAQTAIGAQEDFQGQVRENLNDRAAQNLRRRGNANPTAAQIAAEVGTFTAADRADAETRVRGSRLTDASNAARTEGRRGSAAQRGKEAGVTRSMEGDIDSEYQRLQASGRLADIRSANPSLTLAQARNQMREEANQAVNDRETSALADQAREESAISTRTQATKAVRSQLTRDALLRPQIEAEAARLRTAGVNAAEAQRRAERTVEETDLRYAGEEAAIDAQRQETTAYGKRRAAVETNKAAERKAPVEAVRIREYNRAYNDAIARGLKEEEAQEEASIESNRIAAVEEERLKAGVVSREEQREALVNIQAESAQESTMRQEANTLGTTLGLNQAANAYNALNAEQRITAQTENVIENLAQESARTRADYDLTRPGESLNRSYAAAEADATKVERSKILRTRADEAKKKSFSYQVPIYAKKPDGTEDQTKVIGYQDRTDTIGKMDINLNTIAAMEGRVRELLGDGHVAPEHEDEVIALFERMSITNQGRRAGERLHEELFGGTDGENIDPTRLGGRAREIWEQIQDGVGIKTAPYYTIPPAALFDGISPEAFSDLGYVGMELYFDHVRDSKSDGLYEEAVRNIHEALSNSQTAKNINSDDYQRLQQFLQDPKARKIMEGRTNGKNMVKKIDDEGVKAGALKKFNLEEAERYNAAVKTHNAGLPPGAPPIPTVRIGDYKNVMRPDGSWKGRDAVYGIPVPNIDNLDGYDGRPHRDPSVVWTSP